MIVQDISAGDPAPSETSGAGFYPASPFQMNNPALLAMYDQGLNTDISGIYDDDISDGEGDGGIWGKVLNTGLEGFRVREARKAMRNRPLSPDEASIFTRRNNQRSLSPMGSSVAFVALGAVALVFLLRR